MVASPYLSLLPRVEQLFWGLRSLILFCLLYYMMVDNSPDVLGVAGWASAGIYAVLLGLPVVAIRWWRLTFAQVFWPVFVIDAAVVSWLVYLTGGIASNFFILYYALVPFVGYYRGLNIGLTAAGFVTVAYAIPCFARGGVAALHDFIFRGILLWVFAATMGVAQRYVQIYAQRLLNAMDKLNERTSELERTHAQLETIYETSRSLAELLSVDNVIDRVLTIARGVLRYPVCEIYLWDPRQRRLWLKGRTDQQTSERLERPIAVEPSDLFRRALRGEIVRVVERHDGERLAVTRSMRYARQHEENVHRATDGDPSRSQLAVPMISEGKTIGLLNAESPQANAFSERDERVFSVLAASTAMALVNADLHQQMEKLTIIDELTGVFNFRHFRTRFEDEKRRSARYGQPLALIMVDIDWFKNLNDRYGHEIGNVALRQLATVITDCIRDVDTPARYGGEEFMIILPQTGNREAQGIGERIRRRVERTEFGPDSAGRPIRMSVSIGISSYPENGRSEDDLVEAVDQALYRAKGAGKNAVSVDEKLPAPAVAASTPR